MVTKRERGRKEITQDMVDNFSSILDELDDIEPDGNKAKNTASSLIRDNSTQIKELLKRGYSAEQIIGQLSKIGLDLAPETLKTVVRNTDDEGNAISGKSKKKAKSKTTPKASSESKGNPDANASDAKDKAKDKSVSESQDDSEDKSFEEKITNHVDSRDEKKSDKQNDLDDNL